jgi:hypothetical protein
MKQIKHIKLFIIIGILNILLGVYLIGGITKECKDCLNLDKAIASEGLTLD